jgi:hypothetical protein
MARFKRRLLIVLVLAAALTGLAKLALASAFARRDAIDRIQAAVGTKIEAKTVTLGFTASALEGVRVFETSPTTKKDDPWSAIGAVDADLSLVQLLTNDLGRGVVTLRDVAVTLAFDRSGRLVTRLPTPPEPAGPMPLVRLEGGTFTLRREGIPDEVIHNIRLELRTEGARQTLSGTVDDPDWGQWTVSGGRESVTDPFTLTVKTVREVHATMPLLRRTPFVPPSTWRAVECEGDTDCTVTLTFNPDPPGGRPREPSGAGAARLAAPTAAGERTVHYRAELNPHDTKVYVSSIKLHAGGASGRVVIDDNLLTLEKVRGTASGGEVRLGSTMDFRVPGYSVLQFDVGASRVNPGQLPKSWNVPAAGGQVEGKADLELTLRDGILTNIRGQGQGSLRVLPLVPPLRIFLESDGRRLHFGLGRKK